MSKADGGEDSPLLNSKDLARRYGKTVNTICIWHRLGVLPPPIRLPGSRLTYWRFSAIYRNEEAWLEGRTSYKGRKRPSVRPYVRRI